MTTKMILLSCLFDALHKQKQFSTCFTACTVRVGWKDEENLKYIHLKNCSPIKSYIILCNTSVLPFRTIHKCREMPKPPNYICSCFGPKVGVPSTFLLKNLNFVFSDPKTTNILTNPIAPNSALICYYLYSLTGL